MTRLMGVTMGFLAFLLVGGSSGVLAWVFYPGARRGKPKAKQFLLALLIGSIAAAIASYGGQFARFFQAGQMLEWCSAIVAACLAGCFYAAIAK
jgi:uncharacterized membrane protein YeaQ/YmgE (transglycosylase-associated protein family)